MIEIVTADGRAEQELLSSLRQRSGEVDRKVTAAVTDILDQVRQRGDEAVREYTTRFDGRCPECFEVSPQERDAALELVDPRFLEAMKRRWRILPGSTPGRSSKALLIPSLMASLWASGSVASSGWDCMFPEAPPLILPRY